MKTLTSLLLGTSALCLAAAGAQAADLPVKAKPVEYVKVCNIYGAGFFYVPGTETCLKIGGYVRSDHNYGDGNSSGYYLANANARSTRSDTNYYSYRARINLSTDWRTNTDFGVLRAYAMTQIQQSTGDSATGTAGLTRAFLQFAGFTFGHTVSFFDFFSPTTYSYMGTTTFSGTTSNNGIDLIAYTWNLGNGVNMSFAIEDGIGRGTRVINASLANQFGTGSAANTVTSSNTAAWTPDFTGAIRVDQAWGSMQIMGALHDASGGYYGGVGAANAAAVTSNGHPGNAWGWAVGGGLRLTNFLGPRNTFEVQATYGKGATGYVMTLGSYAGTARFDGSSVGIGYASDGVYVTGSKVELTEAWSVAAGFQHHWNANWRTAVSGGYTEISYGDGATAMLCGANVNSAGAGTGLSTTIGAFRPGAGFNCNPDYSLSVVGTRTSWLPHRTLEIGLDVLWYKVDSAFGGNVLMPTANGAQPAGTYQVDDQDGIMAIMRVQKSILP